VDGQNPEQFANFQTAFRQKYARPEAKYVQEQKLMNRKMKTVEKAQDFIRDVLLQANQLDWT
jgi:hypothetical protein